MYSLKWIYTYDTLNITIQLLFVTNITTLEEEISDVLYKLSRCRASY